MRVVASVLSRRSLLALGHLLALRVTAADEQDRAQVSEFAKRVQEETGETVEIANVDQGYTGGWTVNAIER